MAPSLQQTSMNWFLLQVPDVLYKISCTNVLYQTYSEYKILVEVLETFVVSTSTGSGGSQVVNSCNEKCNEKWPQPHGKAKDNSKLVMLANGLQEGAVKVEITINQRWWCTSQWPMAYERVKTNNRRWWWWQPQEESVMLCKWPRRGRGKKKNITNNWRWQWDMVAEL